MVLTDTTITGAIALGIELVHPRIENPAHDHRAVSVLAFISLLAAGEGVTRGGEGRNSGGGAMARKVARKRAGAHVRLSKERFY